MIVLLIDLKKFMFYQDFLSLKNIYKILKNINLLF